MVHTVCVQIEKKQVLILSLIDLLVDSRSIQWQFLSMIACHSIWQKIPKGNVTKRRLNGALDLEFCFILLNVPICLVFTDFFYMYAMPYPKLRSDYFP